MIRVYKYPITADSIRDQLCTTRVSAPAGIKPISVALVNGEVCVYAEGNPERPTITVRFHVVGTGFGALPDDHNFQFLGTVVDGVSVWHVYFQES